MLDKEKEKRLRAVKIAKAINSIEGVPIPELSRKMQLSMVVSAFFSVTTAEFFCR